MLRELELKCTAHLGRNFPPARSVDLILLKRPYLGIIIILSSIIKMRAFDLLKTNRADFE
jgi:hypothetical protein